MKKLFLFALALHVACPLPAADVQVDVYNFASGQVRNRRVTLTLVDPGPVTVGPWLIAGDAVSQMTGAQGSTVFSNVLAGQYRLDIAGAPGRSFPLGVPDTNALINAVALIGTTNSVPYFYTAQQIDELLAGFEGGSGGAATNVIDVAAGYATTVTTNGQLRTVAVASNTLHHAGNLSHGTVPIGRLPGTVVTNAGGDIAFNQFVIGDGNRGVTPLSTEIMRYSDFGGLEFPAGYAAGNSSVDPSLSIRGATPMLYLRKTFAPQGGYSVSAGNSGMFFDRYLPLGGGSYFFDGAVTATNFHGPALGLSNAPASTLTLSGERLLGRHSAGTGPGQEIVIGSGLAFSGGTLFVSAGGLEATNVLQIAAGYGINVLSNALLRTVAIDSNTVHNAANLSHGKLPVQRLPDAVVYTNNPNVFTASNRFWFTTFTTNVYLDAGLYTVGGSGDVNLDGLLTLEDYVMLNNYFASLTNLTIPQRINSDVNGDGTLNHHDLVMIGYMVSGYSRDEAEVFASSRFMLNPDGSRAILASGTVLHGSIAGATNASPTNLFGVGTLPVSRLATGTANATNFLRGDGSWQPLSGGGGLLAANNLNDVASLGASRTNLLAHDASNLTAGLLPDARLSTNVSLLGSSIATNEIDGTFYNWVEAQTGIVNTNIVNDGEVVVVTNPEGFPFLRSFVSTSSDEFAVARPASLDITENHPQILFEANRLEMTDPAKRVWLDVITSRTLLRGGNQDALTLTSSNVTTHLPLHGYLGRGTNISGIAFDDITVTGEATNVIQVAAGYAITITTNALLRTIAVTSNTVHNAGNLTSGSLPDARLSANVPLKNSTNVFSSSNVFSQPLQLGVSGMGRIQLFDSANTTNYVIRSDEGFLSIDAPSVSVYGEMVLSANLYADTVTATGASNYLANLYSDVFGADEAYFGDLTVGTFYTGITNAPVLGTGPDGELIVGSGGAVDWTGNADQFSVANGTTNIKSGALVTNLVLNGSTGYSTNGGASQLYITVSDDKLKLHGAHIGNGGVFYGDGSGITNLGPASLNATNAGTVGQVFKRISASQGYWADDATSAGGGITNFVVNGNVVEGYYQGTTAKFLEADASNDQITLSSDGGTHQIAIDEQDGITFTGSVTLPSGATATTQSAGDNDTSVATTAFATTVAGNATNSLNTALVTRITDATNHVNLSVLEKRVVSTTNSWGDATLRFDSSTDRVLLTNMAGNLTITGVSGLVASNLNWVTVDINPNGATRTLTVPAEWYVSGFTNSTTVAITNGTWAELVVTVIQGRRTNALISFWQ